MNRGGNFLKAILSMNQGLRRCDVKDPCSVLVTFSLEQACGESRLGLSECDRGVACTRFARVSDSSLKCLFISNVQWAFDIP